MIGILLSFAVGAGVGYAVGRAHMHIVVEALKTDVASLLRRLHGVTNSKPGPTKPPTTKP